ncbi:MAG: tRNA (adenosine(37)-N6)-dimethylallyltransferase MiaA [Oscillospiraceae bacterium]|nr:tRNA (adenosine(37)-N6)-dimethylallyltransferase MiaA [Oscillospiraceae bacterium]
MAELFDRIIAVGGPTGSGKTSLAIKLAEMTGGEIVSCDSMQIYRSLDIGTAKPTPEELASARHWLIDIREPYERYSVADYVADAREVISDINGRGLTAIVCGGTGLYMTSLLSGIRFSEEMPADSELREELVRAASERGSGELLEEIASADPEYAARLEPNDLKRIIRAVEIIRNGSTPSEQIRNSRGEGYPDAVKILVNCSSREVLYRRIEARCDSMMENGIVSEAREVYEHRDTYLTACAAIGYKEFFGYFEGNRSLDDCLSYLKKASRRYAKRQLTWFRRDPGFEQYYSDLMSPSQMAEDIISKKGELIK